MAIYEYPYTDFNEYNLDWCIKRIRDLTDEWAATKTEWSDMKTELTDLKNYIMHYFENLDVQDEIDHKIDEMIADGTFLDIIRDTVTTEAGSVTSDWIADNLLQETGYVLDKSLTVENAAADAKAVGDRFDEISETTQNLWLLGDQSYSISQVVNLDTAIPAGTYTLSAEILSSFSGVSPNYNSKWIFYKGVIASSAIQASPYILGNAGRGSATFTMADYADIIVMYASNNNANSQSNISCEWKNVQLEAGSVATDYLPPVIAEDNKARAAAGLNASDAVKDLIGTYTGPVTKTVYLDPPDNLDYPFIVTLDAKYSQSNGTTEYPYIRFRISDDRNLVKYSMIYEVGSTSEYDIKQLRPIPYIWDSRPNALILEVPDDVTLTIRNAYITKDQRSNKDLGVEFHAHDGDCNAAPPQTLDAFKMAYACGYNSAIVIPKVTSDGVWFCYHDDTFDLATTYLLNADGSTITDPTYDGMRFNQIPWSYLEPLIIGKHGQITFESVHLMKVDEFLEFCSKTGIRPVISMHPLSQYTSGNLNALKAIFEKYGLLDDLIIKQPVAYEGGQYTLSNLVSCYNVFGNVKRYEIDVPLAMPDPNTAISLFAALSQITTEKTIEFWTSQLLTDPDDGQALIDSTIANGMMVSCGCDSYTENGTTMTSFTSKCIKLLMSMGVTEFTEKYNTSNNLYW